MVRPPEPRQTGSMRHPDPVTVAARWHAVSRRQADPGTSFVYAVRTTGVYCRPSCGSRRPLRRNVCFFDSPAQAEAAGFRACLRCRPEAEDPLAARVLATCRRLEATPGRIPTLAELGREAGVSPAHLQRGFKRLLGISPHAYADALRDERLRAGLRNGDDVARASWASGYGSSSRVYEGAAARLGMTPGAYRSRGRGEQLWQVTTRCPLGWLLVAATARGICAVRVGERARTLVAQLRAELPHARITRGDAALRAQVETLVRWLGGQAPPPELPEDVRATAFQRRVREAIRAIPPGETATYAELARRVGRPGAARAVARVCATNPTPLLLPCHRVVPASRGPGGYRLGRARKQALLELELERARRDGDAD